LVPAFRRLAVAGRAAHLRWWRRNPPTAPTGANREGAPDRSRSLCGLDHLTPWTLRGIAPRLTGSLTLRGARCSRL
jgi:hypothetical protein